MTILNLG